MEIAISRIIIFTRDVTLLKNFYTKNFGLAVVEETPNEWVVLNAGAIEIALHKIGESHIGDTAKTTNTKLVFRLKGGVRLFRQKLIDNGVMIKEIKSFPGIPSIFCDGEDPDGNIFQLEDQLD